MSFYQYDIFKILWRDEKKIKTSVLFAILFLTLTACTFLIDAKGATRLSFSVARAVCVSSVKFATSNQINNPAQAPFVTNGPCKLLTWSQCNLGLSTTDAKCRKFKLENCGPPIGTGTGSGAGEARRKPKLKNRPAAKDSRVMNGVDAAPGEFPHLVSINYDENHICHGVILNENYVVTVALCLHKFDEDNIQALTVVGGDYDLKVDEGTEQVRLVDNVILHPQFNDSTTENDIALVHMEAPLEFNELIYPPEFPQRDYDPTGQLGTVAGWGETINYNPVIYDEQPVLQKGSIRVITLDDCKKEYENDPYTGLLLNPTILCAGDGNDTSRACFADRGAPLSVKSQNGCDLLVGIFQFYTSCYDKPNLYANIPAYIEWFRSAAV